MTSDREEVGRQTSVVTITGSESTDYSSVEWRSRIVPSFASSFYANFTDNLLQSFTAVTEGGVGVGDDGDDEHLITPVLPTDRLSRPDSILRTGLQSSFTEPPVADSSSSSLSSSSSNVLLDHVTRLFSSEFDGDNATLRSTTDLVDFGGGELLLTDKATPLVANFSDSCGGGDGRICAAAVDGDEVTLSPPSSFWNTDSNDTSSSLVTWWFDWLQSVNVTSDYHSSIDFLGGVVDVGPSSTTATEVVVNLANLTMTGCGFFANGSIITTPDCTAYVSPSLSSPVVLIIGGGGGGDGGVGGVEVTTVTLTTGDDAGNVTGSGPPPPQLVAQQYWALLLILFPLFTIFGNVLVILSVYKERNLQTVTNYFIISLAVADLLVAALVMPFAVYVLVNVSWDLSPTLCDFYIAMDVTCSTSSIFNLVAISIDRFIAVTRPIQYAKHKNSQRVVFTIAVVWVVSAAIGTPIVLGLNTTPDRDPNLCIFYNSDFIIFSSLSSFYIPTIIMVFLYYRIFEAIRARAKKSAAAKRSHHVAGGGKPSTTVTTTAAATTAAAALLVKSDNVRSTSGVAGSDGDKSETRRLRPLMAIARKTTALTRYKQTVTLCVSQEPDGPTTNTESGSQENEDDEADLEEGLSNADCHAMQNDRSTEFILGPLSDVVSTTTTTTTSRSTAVSHRSPTLLMLQADMMTSNGGNNHDSGYGMSSHVECETTFRGGDRCVVVGPGGENDDDDDDVDGSASKKSLDAQICRRKGSVGSSGGNKRNGTDGGLSGSVRSTAGLTTLMQPVSERVDVTGSLSPTLRRKRPRFHLARSHKSSRKKREKSAAKKERKATKTLAIVLGVFLFCWMPFFTCNIVDAICIKLDEPSWQPGFTVFVLTTWLGYMNSFINPVIYTIFNPEFRKAFKKILFGN